MREYASEGQPEFPDDPPHIEQARYDLTDEDAVHGDWPPTVGLVRFAAVACESCGHRVPVYAAPVVSVDGVTDRIAWKGAGRMSVDRWQTMERERRRVVSAPCVRCGWCGSVPAGITEGGI